MVDANFQNEYFIQIISSSLTGLKPRAPHKTVNQAFNALPVALSLPGALRVIVAAKNWIGAFQRSLGVLIWKWQNTGS